MNRKLMKGLCALLIMLLVLTGCNNAQQDAGTPESNRVVEMETQVQVAASAGETASPVSSAPPTMEPTEEPTPEPTAVPEVTPIPGPTREPEAGDISPNFPNYDTGVYADYSYQSDELRIAINKVVDEENVLTYFVADIWMRNYRCFRTAFSNDEYSIHSEPAPDICKRERAILGVSGSYNKGLVLHNGVLYHSTDKATSTDCLALYTTGELKSHYFTSDGFNASKAVENGVWQGWQFGPVLIHNGVATEGYKPNATRQPRVMIGYYEPGHYVLVLADGRQEGYSIGLNYYECVELMQSLGCVEAYNLDGGESIRMVFMGEVINHPSGDRDGDGQGDRNLVDMLVFAEYDLEGNAPSYEEVTDKVRTADKAE